MSAIVPVNQGLSANPPIQQINTNLNVPGGKGVGLKGIFGGLTRAGGAMQTLNPNASAMDRTLGAITTAAPMLGTALSLGAMGGNWMKDNLPESDFVSGRGSGSQALVGKDQRRKNTQAISETMAPVRELLGTQDLSTAATEVTPTTPGRDTAPPTRTPGIDQKGTQMGGTVASLAPARTPQSDDMDENMKIWAKANPELAKRVKKGGYGYDAIQSALGLSGDTAGRTAYDSQEPLKSEDVQGLMDDSGFTEEEAGAYLSGDGVESVITGDGIETTVNPASNQKAQSLKDAYVKGLNINKGNASFEQIPDFPSEQATPVTNFTIPTDLYEEGAFNRFGEDEEFIPGLKLNSYQSFEDWSRSNTNPSEVQ